VNRLFKMNTPFRIPDNTLISPFLNSKDTKVACRLILSKDFVLRQELLILEHSRNTHYVFRDQVTFVRRGNLKVKMKSPDYKQPYEVPLSSDEAVLTKPGTLFQLINEEFESCATLYVVSPA
jgi:mannose-6-phosphate isomerase-like protein (cupin superfamily)